MYCCRIVGKRVGAALADAIPQDGELPIREITYRVLIDAANGDCNWKNTIEMPLKRIVANRPAVCVLSSHVTSMAHPPACFTIATTSAAVAGQGPFHGIAPCMSATTSTGSGTLTAPKKAFPSWTSLATAI